MPKNVVELPVPHQSCVRTVLFTHLARRKLTKLGSDQRCLVNFIPAATVAAGLVQPWSNGQVEGQDRLKAIKRQMYGRANFHLLRARVLYRV
jgi:transposase